MKEIDFIPEWYKTGRRRKVNYHRQYAVLSALFLAMMVWSFAASHSLSVARAQIGWISNFLAANSSITSEYRQLKSERAAIGEKTDVLERIENKTGISSIIAELAFLMDDNIVLSQLDIQAESIQGNAPKQAKSSVVLVDNAGISKSVMPENDTVLKVVVTGIAVNGSDVASLISGLEDSPYFCRIIPGFSRSRAMRKSMVTEFEISCYVADFVERKQ